MNTNDGGPAATVEAALNRAWHLGQTYWQQADSESFSQHRKADETLAKFRALVADTCAMLRAREAGR